MIVGPVCLWEMLVALAAQVRQAAESIRQDQNRQASGFRLEAAATGSGRLGGGLDEVQDCWSRKEGVVVKAARETARQVFAQDSEDGRARPGFNGA
jgi:hypothetical protein